MDLELHARLLKAALDNGLSLGTHVQQKEEVKLVYSENFIKSGEFGKICKEIGKVPEEVLLEFFRPTGPPSLKAPLYMSKDTNPESFKFNVHKLKRNSEALSNCISDLITLWSNDTTRRLKKHHSINEKMVKGYLKVRDTNHPDEDRKFTHEDIRQAIINYQLWAKAADQNDRVWFQRWSLDGFLRSNKAITEWCYSREEMMAKVGEQYFEIQVEEKDDIDQEVLDKSRLSHLRDLKESIDRGEKLTADWQGFWDQYHHLLDGQS